MAFGLYDATVPLFRQVLASQGRVLEKAEAHCAEKGVAPDTLLQARLHDDMWPFAQQVTSTVSHSIGALRGILGGEYKMDLMHAPADSFAAVKALNASARAELETFTPKDIDARLGKDVFLKFGERRMDFIVEDFLQSFSLPNFYFHATTAYGILRNRGVPVGKGDFLGGIRLKPQ
jgi:hypothetical protein